MAASDAAGDAQRSAPATARLGELIAEARSEIAELCAPQMVSGELPDAQRQIDAVVSMTEQAAHAIMDEAEAIMGRGGSETPQDKAAREAACMRIIEACAFQDITVQRIAKVLKTLQTLERRLARLQESLGLGSIAATPASDTVLPAGEIIDGPAFDGEGVTQDSIDDLFRD